MPKPLRTGLTVSALRLVIFRAMGKRRQTFTGKEAKRASDGARFADQVKPDLSRA